MSNILVWDTETTGIFEWGTPSDDPCQPHLVELAALLVDGNSRELIESMNVIVKPDGWTIPDEVIKIHGITNEKAMSDGIPEAEALEMFIDLYRKCDLRVAHGTTFDNRAIRCALKRYYPDLIPDAEWKDRNRYYCTLINAKKVMGGNKGHTLAECYEHFTENALEDAHRALPDAQACLDIYWHLIEAQQAA